ncbi:hypothetical protein A9239_00460 [Methanosarcina sp. A14]|uniref:Uncharacterized protein n=1 Tax=Methanosarcina barkeri MS TaxID=1434108 RepID=A0A0E3LPF6_METBA|nr:MULTISPECIES: Sjogren's syndrome/scleroderma autoantigen 1 family protein [Methanosarcina]AKB56436.1 hypothetical protein MSBRM_3438 [Methanosarcina barkeri MS]OED13432.1 hypothetical protein A9239_00460 [Methanosarcina sp. A14]
MDSEKDKKVKRIARFLELGGTMLAEHCNVCGAPKFRYQGRVICPICDVQEEKEAPEPAVTEVPAPEPRQSTEKNKSSLETKKRVQAHRQKSRFGPRTSETDEEEEKAIEPIKEEIPVLPSEKEEAGRKAPAVPKASTISRASTIPRGPVAPVIQAAPSERAEKPAAVSKVAGVHRDRKVLEDLLFRKMVNIADCLQDETDLRRIAEDFELIGKGLGLIERLRQL